MLPITETEASPAIQSLDAAVKSLAVVLQEYTDNASPDVRLFVSEQSTLLCAFQKEAALFTQTLLRDDACLIQRAQNPTQKRAFFAPSSAYTEDELKTQAMLARQWIDHVTRAVLEPTLLLDNDYQIKTEALEKEIKDNLKNDKTGKKYKRLQRLWQAGVVLVIALTVALAIAAPFMLPNLMAFACAFIIPAVGFAGTWGTFAVTNGFYKKMPAYHSNNLCRLYAASKEGLDSIKPKSVAAPASC